MGVPMRAHDRGSGAACRESLHRHRRPAASMSGDSDKRLFCKALSGWRRGNCLDEYDSYACGSQFAGHSWCWTGRHDHDEYHLGPSLGRRHGAGPACEQSRAGSDLQYRPVPGRHRDRQWTVHVHQSGNGRIDSDRCRLLLATNASLPPSIDIQNFAGRLNVQVAAVNFSDGKNPPNQITGNFVEGLTGSSFNDSGSECRSAATQTRLATLE